MEGLLSKIRRGLPILRRRFGLQLQRWGERLFYGGKTEYDVFGRESEKRVLLCHIPEAFNGRELPKYHSNFTECHTVARCFDRLGYSIDCVSRGKQGIDYSKYDIVFGINGAAFSGSFTANENIRPLRIFYTVGAQLFYSLRTTAESSLHFHERHNRWMASSYRYISAQGGNYISSMLADAVICLGDSFVAQQYINEAQSDGKIYPLSAFYFDANIPELEKQWNNVRRSLLWFGSAGMLHKGLDIAIDFVASHPEYTLHICGGSSGEKDFRDYYQPIITKHDNIINHGFVNIESKEYADILSQCAILLNPSINEAGAVAVLNVLGNAPLLPVYSRATGLDLEKWGIEVEKVEYGPFEKALLSLEEIPSEEIASRAIAIHNHVRKNYTLDKYEERMLEIIKKIISNRNDERK